MDSTKKSKYEEGPVAKTIEQQTAKLPSDAFLWLALASLGKSVALKCLGKKDMAPLVGQWGGYFLLLGIYNKIVKTHGHDLTDRPTDTI